MTESFYREDGTNKLLGPTESRPADVDELVRSQMSAAPARPSAAEEFGKQLAAALAKELEPYIEWLAERSVDAAVRGVTNLWKWAKSKAAEGRNVADVMSQSQATQLEALGTVAAGADGETDALEVPMVRMSGDEFRARLLSALAAEQYATDQKRLLAKVRIEDDALPTELKSAMKAALEGPASSLDGAALARVRLLGGARTTDGEFLLVGNEGADGPLRLTGGQP